MRRNGTLVLLTLLLAGCQVARDDSDSADESNKTKSKQGIIGKSTNDIGELQPGDNVSETGPLTPGLPVTGAFSAYGSALETLSKGQIHQALEFYNAEHGHYPKSHDEFMQQVIKPNRIKLPQLPGNRVYKYDVANHKLVVVEAESNNR